MCASFALFAAAIALCACSGVDDAAAQKANKPIESDYACFSGIYPHLAFWNNEGECGTGALVVWNGKLWALTYGPHCVTYSSDRLYEIDEKLNSTIRSESVGGTHANRLIHPESNQLFIGCYAIDSGGNVRTIPREAMPGRLTGAARSPWSPEKSVLITSMEEALYEVDVDTLEVKTLIRDGNLKPLPEKLSPDGKPVKQPKLSKLHGYHGKGTSSGYGKVFYSNNGVKDKRVLYDPAIPSGALAEYSRGDADWTPIRIMQFTEIATPDGIFGNLKPDSNPIWAVGFDAKSLVLMVNEGGRWTSFRLPKASHSYDGSHGWNTEWPRIRPIGTPSYLMTMHGAFWDFPPKFGARSAGGLRMASNYLKVVGDFCEWQGKLVLGCDDSAKKEFLNKRELKSEVSAAGQSNSNLVFLEKSDIRSFGPNIGRGSVFLREDAKAGTKSEPMFVGGFSKKIMAVKCDAPKIELRLDFHDSRIDETAFSKKVEIDKSDPSKNFLDLDKLTAGRKFEWVSVTPLSDAKNLTVHFNLSDADARPAKASSKFDGLALREVSEDSARENSLSNAALMLPLGGNSRKVGIVAYGLGEDGKPLSLGTYTFDWKARLSKAELSPDNLKLVQSSSFEPKSISVAKDGVLIVEDGRRFKLPINGNPEKLAEKNPFGPARVAREVATERDLLNCGGIFYELPAKNAMGVSRIRPIASHNLDIFDFCSYRGLMLASGTNLAALENKNPNIVVSDDGKFAIWAGSIDDLWKLGKCVGRGSLWHEEPVADGQYSDPFLLCGFDKKTLFVDSDADISLSLEIDIDGTGIWTPYKTVEAKAGKPLKISLDENCQGYWIRARAGGGAQKLTASLLYE